MGYCPLKQKVSQVNYKVGLGRGRTKALHINNMKKFYVREEDMMRLAVVAEDWEDDRAIGTKVSGTVEYCVSALGA